MKVFIKNNLGMIGFLIFIIGTSVDFIFYYFYNISLDPLSSMSFLAGSAFWMIDWEFKREKPRKWLMYFVISLTVILIGLNLGISI